MFNTYEFCMVQENTIKVRNSWPFVLHVKNSNVFSVLERKKKSLKEVNGLCKTFKEV